MIPSSLPSLVVGSVSSSMAASSILSSVLVGRGEGLLSFTEAGLANLSVLREVAVLLTALDRAFSKSFGTVALNAVSPAAGIEWIMAVAAGTALVVSRCNAG